MRKVELNIMEQLKYETIKKLVETNGNKYRASLTLNCSYRSINRLIVNYKNHGKEAFSHGNKTRKPATTKSQELRDKVLSLYKEKYYDANFTHFNELLKRNENIQVSDYFIYTLLRSNSILAPRCTKKVYKEIQQEIRSKIDNKETLSENEKDLVVSRNILNKEDNHARIPRAKYFGERVEIDASEELWFGEEKATLHGAIDCSTGTVLALYFDKQETLKGYYGMLNQILINYGAPYEFISDNRTVFIYNGLSKENKVLEKDTKTQFGYTCSLLGISIKTTSIPQKKPRIERLWLTLQNRLNIELRLARIKTIEDANKFLINYIGQYNSQFALPIDYNTSVFENVQKDNINNLLSIYTKRQFKASTIQYCNKKYQAFRNNLLINFKDKVECLVIKTYDNRLICNVDEQIYELIELPEKQETSKDFDEKPKQINKKCWTPPLDHPWKKHSFISYLAKHEYYSNGANV